MTNFKCWCDFLSIQGAIDVMHVLVAKPFGAFVKDQNITRDHSLVYVLLQHYL